MIDECNTEVPEGCGAEDNIQPPEAPEDAVGGEEEEDLEKEDALLPPQRLPPFEDLSEVRDIIPENTKSGDEGGEIPGVLL